MELSERIVSFILVLAMSVFFCSCGVEESSKAAPEPVTTETAAAVEDIALMFYTTQIESEFTLKVGETVELWADLACAGAEVPEVIWSSSDDNSLAISFEEGKKEVSVTALNTENSPVILTLSCGDFEKSYTVNIRGEAKDVSIPGSGEALVKDIKLMYFNTELNEFTVTVGETVGLGAEVIYEGRLEEQPIWKSSNENCLMIESDPSGSYGANIICLSAEESPVTLSISCAGFEKDFTVYLHPGN